MADNPQLLSVLSAALSQEFRPVVVRTVNRRAQLLSMLKVDSQWGGKNFAWDWEADGALAETYSEGADANNTGTDAVNTATLNWARYRTVFKVTGDTEAAAMSSNSPAGLLRPVLRNFTNGLLKTSSIMNIDLYSGGGGNAMVGMDTGFRGDNTYATVDRTQVGNATFRGNLIDPGALTDVSIDMVRKDIGNTIYTACGETPDLGVASPAVYYTFANKFSASQRFTTDTLQLASGKTIKFDASIDALTVEGCTIIKDKDATANRLYYINTRYVYVALLQQTQQLPNGNDLPPMQLDDGRGPMPYGMKVYELARTGDARKFTAQIKPVLAIEKPNACGVRVNFAVV